MLALEKIIASFISLPGLFIFLWGLVTLYLFIQKSDLLIKIVAVFSLLLMLFVFTGLGVKIFLFPLENYYAQDNFNINKKFSIVVLGGGINYNIPNKKGELSQQSLERVVKAYQLQKNIDTNIIYSGGVAVGQTGISEADVAVSWLEAMGVESNKILRENKARTTYENGKYIKKWIEDNEIEKIYLVTSAVHMPRSSAVFSKFKIDFIPVISGYLYNHKLSWFDYLPSRGALNANLAAIHEWLGLIWYKISGRI